MEEQNKPATNSGAPEGKPAAKAKKPTKKEEPQKSGGNKGLIIVLVILVLGLGALTGYLFNELSELQAKNQAQASTIEEKDSEIDNITADLEAQAAEYERLAAEYEALGESNEELLAQAEELRSQVDKWKGSANWNASKRKSLQKEMDKLRAQGQLDLIAKDEELAVLKQFADSLKASNDSLYVVQDEINAENASLSDLVRVASVLKAENFKITAINAKNKEYDKDEYKAKMIDKVRIKFNFASNKVAKRDSKEIILRIIEPSGTVLFDLSSGGGSFTNAEGKTDFYTDKQSVLYDNSHQELTFLYNKGSLYDSGTYKVEIYGEGYLIGEGNFVVK